jgi:phosphomevalonate kinase
MNKKNKVYVIDMYDSMVTMVDEYKEDSNIITKIHNTFKPDWNIIFDNDSSQKLPYNQQEVNKINQEGYGEIFERIILYKKGYDQFLNEFHKVLSEY